jgi:hypothetical protein
MEETPERLKARIAELEKELRGRTPSIVRPRKPAHTASCTIQGNCPTEISRDHDLSNPLILRISMESPLQQVFRLRVTQVPATQLLKPFRHCFPAL